MKFKMITGEEQCNNEFIVNFLQAPLVQTINFILNGILMAAMLRGEFTHPPRWKNKYEY